MWPVWEILGHQGNSDCDLLYVIDGTLNLEEKTGQESSREVYQADSEPFTTDSDVVTHDKNFMFCNTYLYTQRNRNAKKKTSYIQNIKI